MADGDKQQPPRYWFPYWSGLPQPPPPSQPSRPPPVRPQLSRRPSPPVAPSPPRRPPSPQHDQPTKTTTVSRGAAPPPPPPQAAPQVSRPSPSRPSPLAPIREPPPPSNSNAGAAAAPTKPLSKPVAPPAAAREAAPKLKDIDVVFLPEKLVAQSPAEIKPHVKAADKEHKAPKEKEKKDETKSKEKEKEKKDETKSKEKEKEKKDETKSKEKEKEKKDETKSKEKEKEKEKKHHVSEDTKPKESKAEQGKLHREIKAGVADVVRKASGGAPGSRSGSGSTSVITLAGENKGASMKVGAKDGVAGAGAAGKERHGRKLVDGSDDGKKAAEGRSSKPGGTMRALVNSNVQVINNSLLLHSSCSGGDPGVHLKLSAKPRSKDKQWHDADDDDDKSAKK